MTLNPEIRNIIHWTNIDIKEDSEYKVDYKERICNSLLIARVTQQDHQLTSPIITFPTGNEILNGTICIEWTEVIDSLGHNVSYTIYYCQYGLAWQVLESNIKTTSHDWNTRNIKWGEFYIKVKAQCSAGLTSESASVRVKIQNELTPEIRFLLTILLSFIIVVLLIGAILHRKRVSATRAFICLNDLKTARIGLCLGSFTDRGLIIKGKNDSCPFSSQQIESLLEYSAVLYQHGKAETMYGPIPITNLKEAELFMEPSLTNWNFISYWMSVKDSTVEDLRITKTGGVVPAILLLFYPKQLDQMVIVKKDNFRNIIKSVINQNTDISTFTNEILNQMEKQLLELFIS